MISAQAVMSEVQEKEQKIFKLMKDQGLDGLCLFRAVNFTWFTAGGTNRVAAGTERGCAIILILEGKKYMYAPVNEIERIMTEQVPDQDFIPVTFEWYENPLSIMESATRGKKIGSDLPMAGMQFVGNEVDVLRFTLTPTEILKAREVADICSKELARLCVDIHPGMREQEMQGLLSGRLLAQGVRTPVLLVGTDERILQHRHPVVTEKKLEKHALFAMVGEKWGIHITLTRSVYFGKLPEALRERHELVCRVDGAMEAATVAGQTTNAVLERAKERYARFGYPDEWKRHHQGGLIAYAPREFKAPDRNEVMAVNQMYGWNPTLQGTKSEETLLINSEGLPVVLTGVPTWWPKLEMEIDGSRIIRPAILEA